MPRSGTIVANPVPAEASPVSAAAGSQPFLLRNPGDPAEPVAAAPAPRPARSADPFEVRLCGKLLRAQLRGTLPARLR